MKTPPLLHAALEGNIESVEWFLGDTPLRHYVEFSNMKSAQTDSRLKHLTKTAGAFERAVSRWLGIQSELSLPCSFTLALLTPSR
jgi:hypothetical protein